MNNRALTSCFNTLNVLFPALWAGMIVGVSFIATPAKFLAPSLGSRTAFDVGRSTFELFNSIEVGLAFVLLGIALYGRKGALPKVVAGVLLILTLAQAGFVLPALGERVAAIIAGYGVAPSRLHTLYVLMELAKVVLLVTVAALWAVPGRGSGAASLPIADEADKSPSAGVRRSAA